VALLTTPTIDKYTVKEVLNKVINTDADALKVDIDNVTLKTEGSDINIEVHTDKAEDSMMMWTHTVKTGTGGTSYVPLIDSDGHLQVDTLSSALPSGAATAAKQDTMIASLSVLDDWDDSNYANVNVNIAGTDIVGGAGAVASGVQRVTLASDDPAVTDLAAMEVLLGTIDADTGAILTAVQILDDWDDSNYANVNANIAGTDIVGGAGAVASGVQRVTLASDDPGVAKLGEIETTNNANQVLLGTIDGDTGSIKTAVELIDDAVATLGTTTYSETSTKGLTVGVVRNDTLAALAGTDNEVAPLQVDKTGALYTVEETGQLGAIFEDGTTAVSSKQVVAIQFLEDTTFTTLTPADSSFIGTASGNGDNIDTGNTFPQGMTIFGRWTAFTLASGSIVAYQGAW